MEIWINNFPTRIFFNQQKGLFNQSHLKPDILRWENRFFRTFQSNMSKLYLCWLRPERLCQLNHTPLLPRFWITVDFMGDLSGKSLLTSELKSHNLGAQTGCRYSPAPHKPTPGSNRPLHPWRNPLTFKHPMFSKHRMFSHVGKNRKKGPII